MTVQDSNTATEQEGETQWYTTCTPKWTWKGTVEAEPFERLLNYAEVLVEDCVLSISPDGAEIIATDPANVAQVHTTVDCAVNVDTGLRTGISISQVKDAIPAYWEGCDDEIELIVEHSVDESTLTISTEYDGETIELLDTQKVRSPPDELVDPYDGVDFTASSWKLVGHITGLARTDCKSVRFTPEDNYLELSTISMDDSIVHTWGFEAPIEPDGIAEYSEDYLRDIMSGLSADGETRVRFEHERPIRFDQDEVTYVLAPRIDASYEGGVGDE